MTQQDLLTRLEAELREILEQVRQQLAPLPEEALKARTAPDKWNYLETFAHLNAFSDQYLPKIELSIHKAKARRWATTDRLRSSWMGSMAVNRVMPGTKARKAPKKINFLQRPVNQEEIKRFIINCERLLRNLQAAREIDLNKPKIPFARFSWFSLTLGDVFTYLITHANRHVSHMVAHKQVW